VILFSLQGFTYSLFRDGGARKKEMGSSPREVSRSSHLTHRGGADDRCITQAAGGRRQGGRAAVQGPDGRGRGGAQDQHHHTGPAGAARTCRSSCSSFFATLVARMQGDPQNKQRKLVKPYIPDKEKNPWMDKIHRFPISTQ
jgi:hypothetical protein